VREDIRMASRLPLRRRPDQVFFFRTGAARLHSKFITIVNQRLTSEKRAAHVFGETRRCHPVTRLYSTATIDLGHASGLMFVALSQA
jgi:hypothetical protein